MRRRLRVAVRSQYVTLRGSMRLRALPVLPTASVKCRLYANAKSSNPSLRLLRPIVSARLSQIVTLRRSTPRKKLRIFLTCSVRASRSVNPPSTSLRRTPPAWTVSAHRSPHVLQWNTNLQLPLPMLTEPAACVLFVRKVFTSPTPMQARRRISSVLPPQHAHRRNSKQRLRRIQLINSVLM